MYFHFHPPNAHFHALIETEIKNVLYQVWRSNITQRSDASEAANQLMGLGTV